MLTATLDEICVAGATGRPRQRPDRLLADKGYPSRANRAWLRERGIAATISERDDQIAHRRKRPGRPIDFSDEQQQRYRGRNVVERCFNKLEQWRGLAMRSDTPPAITTVVSASPPPSTGSPEARPPRPGTRVARASADRGSGAAP